VRIAKEIEEVKKGKNIRIIYWA